ncbi:hypothetical protein [Natrinema salaciae]|uniref:Uncharacterized protein n=1 Tax=Natrinema salaciae TaxID=1186196 RepID=A0A1H9LZK8_9EURY|nr:hypothetical protein [Natrinema salaciae]SER16848.1 hypothetical protein SAMN04489841_3147 [Natrinema salaciae]
MLQRDITGFDTVVRLADRVSSIDRYDLLLGLIPTAFAAAFLAGRVFGLPLEATLLGGVAVASLALFDGLFFRPPTGLQGA